MSSKRKFMAPKQFKTKEEKIDTLKAQVFDALEKIEQAQMVAQNWNKVKVALVAQIQKLREDKK